MIEGLDTTLRWAAQGSRPENVNQMGLFAGTKLAESVAAPPPLSDVPEWPQADLLRAERETIGFFITGHPLDKYERDLRRFTDAATIDLRARDNGSKARVGGVVHSLKLKNSKKGDRYATFNLEDKTGVVEVIAWPETYRKFETTIHADDPVVVSGTLDVGEERCQLIADEIVPLTAAREKAVKQVHFALLADRLTEQHLHKLRDTLSQHRGSTPAFLHLLLPDRTETVIALPSALRVAPSDRLVEEVDRMLGNGVTSFQ